jgi:hypothetical protein
MTDRKPVPEPTLAAQRMAERLMHTNECAPTQPITLPPIDGHEANNITGSITDQWGACLILVQGDNHDIICLDFVQAETLYQVLDQFFN